MSLETEERPERTLIPARAGLEALRPYVFAVAGLVLVYLCWRMLVPFLAALSWALALALIVQPVYAWLLRKGVHRTVAALAIIVLIGLAVLGPVAALAGALAKEAAGLVGRVSNDVAMQHVRETIEKNRLAGPIFRWLDSRFDLPTEAMQLARSVAGWASGTVSSVLTGSMWVLTQIAVALFVLFYFLRDGELILRKIRLLVPSRDLDVFFGKITQMIRVSLGGKLVVSAIQGTLGGLMFGWLGLPAPIFWGTVMAVLSIFPVLGAFIVWAPVAVVLAIEGDWWHALILTGWGVLIVNPVDNLLGPVLVGTTLKMHTLLVFFSIVGGLAAFGPSGVVLGPVIVAAAAAFAEMAENGGAIIPRQGN